MVVTEPGLVHGRHRTTLTSRRAFDAPARGSLCIRRVGHRALRVSPTRARSCELLSRRCGGRDRFDYAPWRPASQPFTVDCECGTPSRSSFGGRSASLYARREVADRRCEPVGQIGGGFVQLGELLERHQNRGWLPPDGVHELAELIVEVVALDLERIATAPRAIVPRRRDRPALHLTGSAARSCASRSLDKIMSWLLPIFSHEA